MRPMRYKGATRNAGHAFAVNWRTGYKVGRVLMREMSMNGHDQNGHNELLARFVAYSSPYLFWMFVSLIAAGILWLR